MNNKETGNTDIWNILLKKVHGKNLKNFNVLDKKSNLNCYYQIFEVLVAETLNICDRNTVWTVSGFHNDGGIDLKGIDKRTFSTPFVPEPIRGISIGQIKRRASGHKFDSFIDDLTKINNYCFKENIYDEYCLVQVLYVLSSDKSDNIKKIKKRYAEAIQNHEILSLNISHNSKLNLIDANNIINTWKLYHNYFSVLLEDALDESELSVFNNYFTTMNLSIISIAQSSQSNKDVFVGEDFLKKITISCSIDNLYVPLYVKWHTVEPGKIQLIYPLQALDPRKNGYKIYINKNADLIIKMRCIEEGLINCGNIEFYSEDGECIACVNLNTVNVISNFEICHFTEKNIKLINDIKRNILSLEKGVSLYRIVGNGGIGKSTVISEVMMHIANMNFMCMNLSHHKDKTHENDMLKSMFKEIIYPFNKQELFHYDSMPDDIRIYLT